MKTDNTRGSGCVFKPDKHDMSLGGIGILNVGCGDTKLTFDKNDPAECIRAARIVTDMLRRGYALLVEVEQSDGTKKYQRVLEFKEDTCEYIIADFDPVQASRVDGVDKIMETTGEQAGETAPASGTAQNDAGATAERPKLKRGGRRAIPASGASGVAVARSAGG